MFLKRFFTEDYDSFQGTKTLVIVFRLQLSNFDLKFGYCRVQPVHCTTYYVQNNKIEGSGGVSIIKIRKW